MKIGRAWRVELIDKIPQRLFSLGRTAQLQKQVRQREVVRNGAEITVLAGFRTGVAFERHQRAIVDGLPDQPARGRLGVESRKNRDQE